MLLALLLLGAAPATPPPAFDALMKEAAASGTPVLLDVYTVWCVPCAKLKKEVLDSAPVKQALAGVRLVEYDAERGPGVEAARRFDIHSYPTVLMLTPDGVPVAQLRSQDVQSFLAELAEARRFASVRTVPEPGGSTPAATLFVSGKAALATEPDKALALFERAEAADSGNDAGVVLEAAMAAVSLKADRDAARARAQALGVFIKRWPASSHAVEQLRVVAKAAAAQHLEPALYTGPRDALVQAWAKSDRAEPLNELIYTLLELGELESAGVLAARLEALAPASATYLDTVAEVAFRAGDRARAVTLSKRAVELERDANVKAELAANLARFEKGEPAAASAPAAAPDFEKLGLERGLDMRVLATQLGDACPLKGANAMADVVVRLYFADPKKVTRAAAFDPRAPGPLLRCLEKAAVGLDSRSLTGEPWVDVHVSYGLPPH